MPFTPVITASGQILTDAIWNTYVRDNFAASAPDIFTTKGDIMVASGNDAAGRLGVGTDFQVPHAKASATLGVEYSSGIYSVLLKAGAQTISDNTFTKITISTVASDFYSMYDAVNSRLTIPSGWPTRFYNLQAGGWWSNAATTGKYRHIEIRVNGTAAARQSSGNNADSQAVGLTVSRPFNLVAGNYIELWVLQISGGNLNFNDSWLALTMMR